jgi:hypothetical protein
MSRTGEIRERAEAAPKGPWRWNEQFGEPHDSGLALTNDAGVEIVGAYNDHCCSFRIDPTVDESALAFIAAARSDIPFLLEQLSKAEQLIDGIREAVVAPDQFHRRVNSITRLLAGYQTTGGSE